MTLLHWAVVSHWTSWYYRVHRHWVLQTKHYDSWKFQYTNTTSWHKMQQKKNIGTYVLMEVSENWVQFTVDIRTRDNYKSAIWHLLAWLDYSIDTSITVQDHHSHWHLHWVILISQTSGLLLVHSSTSSSLLMLVQYYAVNKSEHFTLSLYKIKYYDTTT